MSSFTPAHPTATLLAPCHDYSPHHVLTRARTTISSPLYLGLTLLLNLPCFFCASRNNSCSESQEPYTALKRIWDLLARGGILDELDHLAPSPGVQSGSTHLCHMSAVEPCHRTLQTRRRCVRPFPLPRSLQYSSIPSGYIYFVNCSPSTTITPYQLALTTHRRHAPLPH